jgi:hypothetical protein
MTDKTYVRFCCTCFEQEAVPGAVKCRGPRRDDMGGTMPGCGDATGYGVARVPLHGNTP